MKRPTLRSQRNPLLPTDPDGNRLCSLFGQYVWKPITADLPDDATAKPQWCTQTKYPIRPRVLWSLWQDANTLVGVRFGHTTSYALIDLDAGSLYCSAEGVTDIRAALETIGITRTLLLRSSWSGGLHLYLPLPEAVPTFDLAVTLKECLKAQGIPLAAGQVEIFPNVKAFGVSIFVEYNAHRLPLQPGSGSCQLDDDLNPIASNLTRFLWQWEQSAPQQDLEALRQALKIGRDNHRKRPKRKIRPVESWRLDLETELAEGWNDHGQTNHLLKTIACYGRVFEGLGGEALIEYVHRIAITRPGYEQYCGHQADILRRCQTWARAAEHYYWPLGTEPTRDSRALPNEATPFNQQRADEAKCRIQRAIAHLSQLKLLPEQITARAKEIAQVAHVSLQTLYKHLNLWHPAHQLPRAEEEGVMPSKSGISADSPTLPLSFPEDLEPSEDKELHTTEKNMKCVARKASGEGSDLSIISSERGEWGDELNFPQPKAAPPIPLDELHALIQRQVQRLGWTVEQAKAFVASHFGDRGRSQLQDDELPTLLYYLEVEVMKTLGAGHA